MSNENEEQTYDEVMIQVNKPPPPPLTSVDKKRLNKTMTCPLCNKQVNSKTMKYTHDCQKTKKENKHQ